MHDFFFHSISPCKNFFLRLGPPPPHNFSNGPSLLFYRFGHGGPNKQAGTVARLSVMVSFPCSTVLSLRPSSITAGIQKIAILFDALNPSVCRSRSVVFFFLP